MINSFLKALLYISMFVAFSALTIGAMNKISPGSAWSSFPSSLIFLLFLSVTVHWGMWLVALLVFTRPELLYPWSLPLALVNVHRLFKGILVISQEYGEKVDTSFILSSTIYFSSLIVFIITHLFLVHEETE